VGGVLMLFGSRLGAGCTSGHGLSGSAGCCSSARVGMDCQVAQGVVVVVVVGMDCQVAQGIVVVVSGSAGYCSSGVR
jgi:hypothetical protein